MCTNGAFSVDAALIVEAKKSNLMGYNDICKEAVKAINDGRGVKIEGHSDITNLDEWNKFINSINV